MSDIINKFIDAIRTGYVGKKGPVFLEIPIDIQAFSFQDEIKIDNTNYTSSINKLFCQKKE